MDCGNVVVRFACLDGNGFGAIWADERPRDIHGHVTAGGFSDQFAVGTASSS